MSAIIPTSESSPPIEASETILLHSGMHVTSVFGTYICGAMFPLVAGFALLGWRAMLAVAAVVGSAIATAFVWRRIGLRGGQIRYMHMIWLALVLSLMLPAQLAVNRASGPMAQIWPILPAAGTTLVILNWLLGGLGLGRVHPVLVTYLLMVALFGQFLTPYSVLQRSTAFTGNVLDTGPAKVMNDVKEPWVTRPIVPGQAALRLPLASEQLQRFTSGVTDSWISIDSLVRDHMPPIQDLILGGQPGPIGLVSIVGVVAGGLFLLYRGLIDFRVPLLIITAMTIALYILPVPVVIGDTTDWRWLAIRDPRVSWPTAMTFVHYEVLASPALFMAIFLAADPSVRPMAKWARSVYAITIGILAAIGQRYLSVSVGPYVALLVGSMLTPFFDRAFQPKPLV